MNCLGSDQDPSPSLPVGWGCPTWMTLMLRPVSWASCSRMWRVGLGVAAKAALRVSSCLALMVVRGPLRLVPEFCSSFSLLVVSLSEEVELSVSLVSSCMGSWRSGDKLLSVHEDTVKETQRGKGGADDLGERLTLLSSALSGPPGPAAFQERGWGVLESSKGCRRPLPRWFP